MYVFSRRIIYLQYKQEDIFIMMAVSRYMNGLKWKHVNLIDLSIPFQHSQKGFIIQIRTHDMIGPMRLSFF